MQARDDSNCSARSFADLLRHNLPARADHPMLVERNRQMTYAQVAERVDSLAARLASVGVRRGDRVAIHLHKSIEEVVATFAAAHLGAVFTNINHQWTTEQLVYVLRDCAVTALIADERPARRLAAIPLPDCLRHVIVKGRCPAHPKMTPLNEIPPALPPPLSAVGAADLAAILYTSGSTGHAKGVMLSNQNLVLGARSVADYLENGPDDRLLSLLPFSFDYGLSQLTTMCLVGGTLVLEPVMMPAEIAKTLQAQQITGLAAVPPAWIGLVRYLMARPIRLPALRYVTNSSGKIPDLTLEQMPQVFPGVKIYLMYGLTEAFRSTFLRPDLYGSKMGSIGRAIPNVETYVIDPEIGVCGPGQQGELVHRGPLISKGYWGQPEATAQRIKPCPQLRHLIGDEKVLYSGDIVRIDEDGDYWFVGRCDAMIKSSGFRISPTEVEDIVARSGLVTEVVAFGVPDELLGQAVEVAVSGLEGRAPDGDALQLYCRRQMPSYMVPRRIHCWDGELPHTSSGKVDRNRVRGVVATPRAALSRRE